MDYFSKNRAFTRNDSKLMRNEEIKEKLFKISKTTFQNPLIKQKTGVS